jgi:hypothetical protein
MSKIFTDAQVNMFAGDPIQKLMVMINEHTNSREYATVNLAILAELAEKNLDVERAEIKLVVKGAK